MSSSDRLADMVREAQSAVRSALSRSHLHRAWELLQERDAEGKSIGALPYTEPALAELAEAHRLDPDDINVVHHLAIGHHARAWDLELRQDPRALAEWERALGLWRTLRATSEFWAALRAKLATCDKDADPAFVGEVRQNLLESLLEVHVDFVRHYCETGVPQRATDHVEIVTRARIPPAAKKRLVHRVFEAMTGAVPEARATFAFDSALTTCERFLALFPDYLPALRLYAEICKDSVEKMSYQQDWEDIRSTAGRAEPYAQKLAGHPRIDDDPLAKTALEEFVFELALRCRDRSESLLSGSITTEGREAAKSALELGITWGRTGIHHYPSSSDVRTVFAACLQNHAYCLYLEEAEVMASATDYGARLAVADRLLLTAVEEMEEALPHLPDENDYLNSILQQLRKERAEIQEQKMLRLFGNLENQP